MYRRHPQIEEAPLAGESMLFDPVTGRFFVLNGTMAYIWRLCDGQHDFHRLLEKMRADFADVESHALEPDLRNALQELATLGLIMPSDGAPTGPPTSGA